MVHGTLFVRAAIGTTVCLYGVIALGTAFGHLRVRGRCTILVFLLALLAFPFSFTFAAYEYVRHVTGTAYMLSHWATEIWIVGAPLLCAAILSVLWKVSACSVRYRSPVTRGLLLCTVLPLFSLAVIADAAVMFMADQIVGSEYVTRVVTPDGKWQVTVLQEGFVDLVYVAYLERNTPLPLLCRRMGHLEIPQYEAFSAGELAVRQPEAGHLTLWNRGRVIGIWQLEPLRELPRDQTSGQKALPVQQDGQGR
jgi:hypothetical protein